MIESKPSAETIARINAEHLLKTPLKPADLLFVFGTRDGVSERIDAACRLWRDGYCRWLIVSGGPTPGSHLTECQIITAGLLSRGVPAERILGEHRATNTGVNVIFALPAIDARLGLNSIDSVICLGNLWTSRRYPMTLHRHWPAPEKMLVTVNHYPTPDVLWHTHAELCARVLGEWEKIEPCRAKGFIADWP
jgi:uncharacterized SAM-binding protein YcdF (DUF218 family)